VNKGYKRFGFAVWCGLILCYDNKICSDNLSQRCSISSKLVVPLFNLPLLYDVEHNYQVTELSFP